MPQLDISTYTSQLFWLCVSFFTMLFIMSKFIIPKVGDILAQRQRKIDSYLNKAHTTKQQAEAALEKYHQALADATQKAEKTLQKTQAELDRLVSDKQNELREELRRQISKQEAEIAAGKAEALTKIREMSAELAADIVKKLALTDINAADIKNAIKKNEQ